MKRGILVLEDGNFFTGRPFGGPAMAGGEVVFNTSLTGYQEILTDPSYKGQVVTLTTAHVGNYGVNAEDIESATPSAAGLIVRDYHPVPSNWRSNASLHTYLEEAGIPGLSSVDTRALVLHIRSRGVLRGVIRPLPEDTPWIPIAGHLDVLPEPVRHVVEGYVQEAKEVPPMSGLDLASRVTTESPWSYGDETAERHVVAMDFGLKRNIVRQLAQVGCRVTVVPAQTSADAIRALNPDGLLLSNGPGDPEPVQYAVATIRELLGEIPIFGICLGHQLLGLAVGGKTYKMSFGHRGGNHPVRDLDSGRVEITAQNHGFAIDASSLDGREVAITHLNLNDETIAGIRHKRHLAFSVQFHPEASPGPHDSHHLFQQFVDLMERAKR
ncbi:MAG: glutamine-hydrolyzing carbamoyl-phosphate synthase small subunit [Myxococcota bacterium]